MSMNYDVLIIGAGPSGLTAGLYAARAGLRSCCLEQLSAGGQAALTAAVENYPGFDEPLSGLELGRRMEKQARRFGLEIVREEVERVMIGADGISVQSSGRSLRPRALIVASGTKPKGLGVPGETEFKGKGVSYCATCDGPLFRDKDVVVVGGGDAALEEALFLTRFCRRVYVIHRRGEFRAVKVLVERATANEGVELITHSVIQSILGSKGVEAVEVRDVRSGNVKNLATAGVFLYVDVSPNTGFLPEEMKTDELGYVITDEEMRTSIEGVFAAGDVRKKSLRQISTAVGDGAIAAMSAVRYLESHEVG